MPKTRDPDFAVRFGLRVCERREQLGWTQRDLRERTGLSVGYLSDLENGKRGAILYNAVLLATARAVAGVVPEVREGDDGE